MLVIGINIFTETQQLVLVQHRILNELAVGSKTTDFYEAVKNILFTGTKFLSVIMIIKYVLHPSLKSDGSA